MIEELKTFISVVEYKNFTKAAEAINLSQPSVSLHIKHLEEYFNATLIQRSIKQKNIHITESGNLLYERSKQIIKLLEDTKDDLLDYGNIVKGRLRIGASFTIGEYFLPHFLGQFTKAYPDLELEIAIENTHNICEKVKNFQVDLALVEGTVPSSNFVTNNFYKDKMVVAVPYNHYLVSRKFSVEELGNQTWISREIGSGTREYLELFLSTNNINAKNVIVFGSNYSVKEAVKNNLGITFISSLVTETALINKELSILKTPQQYIRPFSYILQKGITPSKGAIVFIDMLKNYKKSPCD
ncbi:LysR substrate-binding domain-containing protein [Clostridium sp. A1-XYC3]|uniref:LysR substrate-binding domain-containing protein n=1 Tax=Clostridium tanneri TaxID=3037988 RepID=A0ABU4JXR2_9CLOT|nr:LysR substrate-binding domain-containing protein [Clostridium sp. A1-XYC3]MDW8802925.1 LysR substrate-binding domain-containing protein [Clostridium sp. A1-XYC3]